MLHCIIGLVTGRTVMLHCIIGLVTVRTVMLHCIIGLVTVRTVIGPKHRIVMFCNSIFVFFLFRFYKGV